MSQARAKLTRLIKLVPQQVLPHHLLGKLMYSLTRCGAVPVKNLLIRAFIRLYGVDMKAAVYEDAAEYPDFNSFFTRELDAKARPIDPAPQGLVSPVDGTVSQVGHIRSGHLLQAKGIQYTALELLGNDPKAALRFSKGAFVTLYLSPRDYHRVHMPIDGYLERMTYVPGKLFSVSPYTTENLDQLFTRNERIISLFETPHGLMAVVMVGALFVGGMETVWAGPVTPAQDRSLSTWSYQHIKEQVQLARGAEMGRFNMGSTVILLFEKERVKWPEKLKAGMRVKMGQRIGTFVG